jgi:hypothetical protein
LAELAAATAVVRHYYAIANALRRHMDAAALAALFTPACPCQAQARAVRRAAAKHEHYVDQATLNALRPSLQDRTHAYVLVDLNASRGGLVRSDGARITSVPAQRHVQRVFRLALINGHWRIYRIEAA